MLNKFFLDANFNVKMLSNIQRPYSDDWLWDNRIEFEIDADDSANQYLFVEYGENTATLNITPGQVNEILLIQDYWNYGGVSKITPYKNGSALSPKYIEITIPDTVESSGALSSTESNADGSIKLGNLYALSGSYTPTPEVIEQLESRVVVNENNITQINNYVDILDRQLDGISTDVTNLGTAVQGNTQAIQNIQQNLITYGTAAKTPGTSPLTTGTVYLQYE